MISMTCVVLSRVHVKLSSQGHQPVTRLNQGFHLRLVLGLGRWRRREKLISVKGEEDEGGGGMRTKSRRLFSYSGCLATHGLLGTTISDTACFKSFRLTHSR